MTETTCQICGRAIKAKNGLIAHHGYRRPGDGYQTASCYGAKFRPYEVAHDALDRYAADIVDRFLPAARERLAKFVAEPPATLDRKVGYNKKTYERPEGFDVNDPAFRSHWYTMIFKTRRGDLAAAIPAWERDLEYVTTRRAAWKEAA